MEVFHPTHGTLIDDDIHDLLTTINVKIVETGPLENYNYSR